MTRRFALAWLVVAACHAETTYDDVQPILEARCNSCHVDGVSTFQPYFTGYDSVAPLRRILRDAVSSRHMPPFAIDNTTACGGHAFADEGLWLSDPELLTITDWVDDGVPRGRGDHAATTARAPEPGLAHVDRSVGIGYVYNGLDPASQHRCFVVDPAIVTPALLSAFEVEPGNRFAVQSVALFALDDAAPQTAAAALDAASAEVGYPCFGGAGIAGARFVGSWVWGRSVVRFPAGTGIALPPATRLVVQIHYNPQGGTLHPAAGETRIHLELTDTAIEASYLTLAARGFRLQPGDPSPAAHGFVEVDRGFRILGVAPLMQHAGKALRIERVRPFSTTCVAQVNHWEMYNHLRLYQFQTEPPEVLPGDRLDLACEFGIPNRLTVDGEDASNEQCVARLYVVP